MDPDINMYVYQKTENKEQRCIKLLIFHPHIRRTLFLVPSNRSWGGNTGLLPRQPVFLGVALVNYARLALVVLRSDLDLYVPIFSICDNMCICMNG